MLKCGVTFMSTLLPEGSFQPGKNGHVDFRSMTSGLVTLWHGSGQSKEIISCANGAEMPRLIFSSWPAPSCIFLMDIVSQNEDRSMSFSHQRISVSLV